MVCVINHYFCCYYCYKEQIEPEHLNILKRKRKTIKKTKIVSADDADECMCVSSYDSREKKTQMLQLNQMITHQCSAVSNEFDFEGTTFPAALFDVGHVILLFHLNHSKTYVWTYKETDTLKGSSFFSSKATHRPAGKLDIWRINYH